jgi:hypothetical protein
MKRRCGIASSFVLALVSAATGLAGCASRSTDVAPLAPPSDVYAGWGCEQLYDEADRLRLRGAQVAYAVDERAGNNIIALGLGVTVFWPALLAMRPDGPDATELAQLKGRDEAVRAALAQQRCPPAPVQLPPGRAAMLPLAVGDRLVYEERGGNRSALRELRLQVTALKRTDIEFRAQQPGADGSLNGATWQQDLSGNVHSLPERGGWLHWRRLLRADLALGDVLAGELVGGDTATTSRVRGQVIALGVKTSVGRPFDAAVIELFGDVPADGVSSRVDGVMVVDRKSGVLLRLELRSGNPEFSLRRTLVRIEPTGP